jgi:hypothetical protein
MTNDEPDPPEGRDRLITEMRELRQDFQEYVETTTQYQTSRRVENIQVLIALSVVGGAISLYSGRFLESTVWKNQIQSPYWIIILKVFIGSNALFLILKLITIPLLPVSSSGFVAFLHDEIEPFLYFFAVLGVVFALLMRGVSIPFYEGLSVDQRGYLAIISLILPLLIAGVYAQSFRISSALQRDRPLFIEINSILDELVRTGAISAEMQTRLMRNILSTMTPSPVLLILLDTIEDVILSLFDASEKTTDAFVEANMLLAKSLTYTISPNIISVLTVFNQNLEDILIEKQTGESKLSKNEKMEVRNRIIELRNKSAHGELTEEDLMELNKYLEQLENDESDDEE